MYFLNTHIHMYKFGVDQYVKFEKNDFILVLNKLD